jgi:hypothetical protein
MRFTFFLLLILAFSKIIAQMDPFNGAGSTVKLNDDGSHYIKFTLTNQVWARYNQSNPGSTVFGTPKAETFDIGIRRSRIQLFGALNKRAFVYVQLGMNNFNQLSDRKVGLFFHDAIAEYSIVKDKLSIGGGLTNVHPSAANQFLLSDSQWFTPDHGQIGFALKDVYENYKNYTDKGKRQAFKSKNELFVFRSCSNRNVRRSKKNA